VLLSPTATWLLSMFPMFVFVVCGVVTSSPRKSCRRRRDQGYIWSV
jgi:hypothetical protein